MLTLVCLSVLSDHDDDAVRFPFPRLCLIGQFDADGKFDLLSTQSFRGNVVEKSSRYLLVNNAIE